MSLKYRIALVIFILEALMMGVVFSVTLARSDQINLQQLEVNEGIITSLLGDLSRAALFTGDFSELQPYSLLSHSSRCPFHRSPARNDAFASYPSPATWCKMGLQAMVTIETYSKSGALVTRPC